ncbi:MAG: response regulator [Cyanobacteria bacterium J06598_4]
MTHSILVVEDNNDLQVLFKLLLESEGYEVTIAHDGKEALSILESTHPQLILMDIMMPDISGLEVSHRIKQKQNFRALPIILVSAIDRLQKQQLDYSKANDILYKPFNLDDLVNKVKEFMGASQFNSELISA